MPQVLHIFCPNANKPINAEPLTARSRVSGLLDVCSVVIVDHSSTWREGLRLVIKRGAVFVVSPPFAFGLVVWINWHVVFPVAVEPNNSIISVWHGLFFLLRVDVIEELQDNLILKFEVVLIPLRTLRIISLLKVVEGTSLEFLNYLQLGAKLSLVHILELPKTERAK